MPVKRGWGQGKHRKARMARFAAKHPNSKKAKPRRQKKR